MQREGGDVEHATLERKRELDHAHRTRVGAQSSRGLRPILTLSFLRAVARGWLSRPRRQIAQPVPRPQDNNLAVSFVGHATVLLTFASRRLITDPLFAASLRGVRRAATACIHPKDLADVDLILISHAHVDHLHLPSLRRLPRTATLVVPPRCAPLVQDLGFARVEECAPGQTVRDGPFEITAVAARHDGARSVFDRTWRGANGYVIRGPGPSCYFAGATGYFSGFSEIGRHLRPDVALLPIAGYEPPPLRDTHMSPLDALAAFEDLGAALLVPISHGSFPLGYEPIDEPLRWLIQLVHARGIAASLRALGHGETCMVRAARPAVDGSGGLV